ncbi:c-type cytochrome [Glacieibacterium frigidum]|uniref:Cytochrome c family protein n=1 Tax=Glacieibacterium frigidum TaxID=2593303 RepID=A0A552U8B0_9SPHN|nr:cytochrome c family protein [Glacieibacterium frigidum]TRW14441.1 cytochrome c family protein [Glacieibacterium frigidum]
MKTLIILALATATPAIAAGDPAVGARLFLQCRACHTQGDRNGIGPNLSGIVGAKAAQRSGYTYSPALIASGLTWTPENLDKFLTKPGVLVPGNKMTFPGIATQKGRDDVIAYLATLKAK